MGARGSVTPPWPPRHHWRNRAGTWGWGQGQGAGTSSVPPGGRGTSGAGGQEVTPGRSRRARTPPPKTAPKCAALGAQPRAAAGQGHAEPRAAAGRGVPAAAGTGGAMAQGGASPRPRLHRSHRGTEREQHQPCRGHRAPGTAWLCRRLSPGTTRIWGMRPPVRSWLGPSSRPGLAPPGPGAIWGGGTTGVPPGCWELAPEKP